MATALPACYEAIEPGVYRSANWRLGDFTPESVAAWSARSRLKADASADNVLLRRLPPLPDPRHLLPNGEPVRARLVIRAYAHDRLVLAAQYTGMISHKSSVRAANRCTLHAGRPRVLERHRETQECFPGGPSRFRLPRLTRFTRHMATMVRDGGHLIERDLRGKAMFITLTIAGGTLGAYEVMSAKSGHIVNIFNTWLRDRCLHGWYTYVWELQGRGAPHLHYLCTVPKNVTVREFRESVHREWRKILCDLSDATGVDLFRAADGTDWRARQSTPWVGVKLCTHDLGRYMAKYASKSRSKGGDAPSWRPGRWAALSYPLRAAVLKERVVVRIDFAGEKEARLALSRLVSAAALKCHAPFYVPAERCYGALVCSVDTFVGCAKPLALALYELQLTGEINPVLALTSVDRKAA